MKKILFSILLIGIILIGFTGCGKEESKHSIGDKVSTDLVEVTIETSELTIAINKEGKPMEYKEDSRYYSVASKGHVYASFTFIIKNLDRSSLNLDNKFVTVKYNDKEANVLNVVAKSEDLAEWNSTSSISLKPDEELTYRAYVEIDCDAKSLEDDFDVILDLPKSDGTTESFKYLITKNGRDNANIREITLETAIKKYPLEATLEYFEKHMDEFTTLTTDEIKTFVKSNGTDHYIKFYNNDYKHYEFRDKGVDGNLIIWPGGTGASSFMYDVDKWSAKDNALKIRKTEYILKKLNDTDYLLIDKEDNDIAGLMY